MDYNDLGKSLPTALDLKKLKAEHRKLKSIIEQYIAGSGSSEDFIHATQKICDLSLLARKATERIRKSQFRVIST